MQYRQFGRGKYPHSSEHNLAQNYIELNAEELAKDGKIIGICTSTGTLTADVDPHTVLIDNYIARTPAGERIYITSTALNIEPDTAVTPGLELWVTVYAEYVYLLSELDIANTGIPYYKDYQNDYVFGIITGDLSSTGTAVKQEISSTGVLLFDVLYNNALYTTGILSDSDINIDRQIRNWHTHSNLAQLELIVDGLHDVRTTNPHSVTKSQVGLGNVTNNTQIRKISSSTIGNIPSWDGITGELLDNGYTAETILLGTSTGIPTAAATKTYADDFVELEKENVLTYKGTYNIAFNTTLPAANAGHAYKIIGNGLLGNSSTGIGVSDGELIICLTDSTPSGTYSDVGQYWGYLQKRIEPVLGSGVSVANNIPVFSGSTGHIIIDSGYAAQAATVSQKGFVQLSDSYTGTSSGLAVTELALSNGLAQFSNVTNDAQLKREAGDFNTFSDVDPADLDTSLILIEDSDDSYTKKTRQVQDVILTLPNAIHLTSSGEIDTLDLKVTLSNDDVFLIEDSEDSYSKKKIKVFNISEPIDSFTSVKFTNSVIITSTGGTVYFLGGCSTGLLGSTSTGDIGELSITSSDIKKIFIYSNLDLLSSYPTNINTWVATGNLNTAREGLSGAGTQNSALSFGGNNSLNLATTEKFNGTSWATTGGWDLNTARWGLAGAGIQNAALSFGGYDTNYSAVTEKFNGSTWVATGNLNTARQVVAGSGRQNSALSFGGTDGSESAVTEKFNGSTWTTDGGWDLNTSRQSLAGIGVQNSSLSFGGATSTGLATTEKFNGSAWSTNSSWNLNTARRELAGSGTQNSALSFGGYISADSAVTEKFNGSTWATNAGLNLNNARNYLAGCGVQNSALSFGGSIGAVSAVTEKFNEPYKLKLNITAIENTYGSTNTERIDISTNESNCSFTIQCPANISYGIVCERIFSTYTSTGLATSTGLNILNYGSWSVTGNLNTARSGLSGCGLQNSALSFGGMNGSYLATTEKFNGTSWSTDGGWDLSTARSYLAGAGTQNAALSFGGGDGGGPLATTEKFNGSVWTTDVGWNLNTARTLAGTGTQNAALSFGGSDATEKFNGSTWITTGNLNTNRNSLAGSGIQSAALSFGGWDGSYLTTTEKFNGSVWVTAIGMTVAKEGLAGSGIQNLTLAFGGDTGSVSFTTEKFNGSTWIYTGSMNIAREFLSGVGIQNSSLSFGGIITGTYSNVTEKFNYNADIAELFATEDYYVNKSNVVIEY